MVKEFRTKKRVSGGIEWDFVIGFLAILILWLIVGHQLLYNMANGTPMSELEQGEKPPQAHPMLAYGIFLVIFILLFFMIGQVVHKGILTALVGVIGYIIIDIWTPPIMIEPGIVLKSPIFVGIGSLCLLGGIIFFIIANRISLPFKIPLFAGFVLLGILLLVLGVKYTGDPFSHTPCSEVPQPPQCYCHTDGGDAVIPGNLAISSQSFLYLIFRNFIGLPHIISWMFTYLMLPVFTVLLMAIFLTRDQMKKTFGDGLAG